MKIVSKIIAIISIAMLGLVGCEKALDKNAQVTLELDGFKTGKIVKVLITEGQDLRIKTFKVKGKVDKEIFEVKKDATLIVEFRKFEVLVHKQKFVVAKSETIACNPKRCEVKN